MHQNCGLEALISVPALQQPGQEGGTPLAMSTAQRVHACSQLLPEWPCCVRGGVMSSPIAVIPAAPAPARPAVSMCVALTAKQYNTTAWRTSHIPLHSLHHTLCHNLCHSLLCRDGDSCLSHAAVQRWWPVGEHAYWKVPVVAVATTPGWRHVRIPPTIAIATATTAVAPFVATISCSSKSYPALAHTSDAEAVAHKVDAYLLGLAPATASQC